VGSDSPKRGQPREEALRPKVIEGAGITHNACRYDQCDYLAGTEL